MKTYKFCLLLRFSSLLLDQILIDFVNRKFESCYRRNLLRLYSHFSGILEPRIYGV